jgi:hypothetical protein
VTTDPPTTTTTAPPSYLTPALPPTSATKPVKVLLVGDSIAGSLGVGLALARGETFDQVVGGQWQNLGLAPFDRYVEPLPPGGGVLGSRGASVVLMTTPYYDSGVPPAGGGRVYVFDLNTVVSPGRQYAASIGPVNVRCTDGVHFTRSGGIYVGIRLAPELAAPGQAHAAASPGGTWPGSLPPSTPSWFQKLPCQ